MSSCSACSLAVVAFPPRSVRLRPPFDGLPVLRDHPTPLVPSPLCPFVLVVTAYAARGGGREVSPGKNAELHANPVACTCPARRNLGFAAACRLTPRLARLVSASLVLGSALHLSLPPDRPSRGRPWLVGDGFRPSQSQEDFHLQFRAHAGRTRVGFAARFAAAPLTRPARGPDLPAT